jgi:hypothetical protein
MGFLQTIENIGATGAFIGGWIFVGAVMTAIPPYVPGFITWLILTIIILMLGWILSLISTSIGVIKGDIKFQPIKILERLAGGWLTILFRKDDVINKLLNQ